MKKITFIILLTILPLVGFAQFDFTSSDDGWNTLFRFTATTNPTFYTLTSVVGDGATLINPNVEIPVAAGIDADVNKWVGVTIKNNDATGPTYLRFAYRKTDDSGWTQKNSVITSGDGSFQTYWIDLTNSNWSGTKDRLRIQFKTANGSTSGADYIIPSGAQISIDIDKIEFAASPTTTLKETFNFDTDNLTEGFLANNGSISGPTGGILTFTPTPAKFAKLEQTFHHADASANKYVHITLKNNSALNDQLRLVAGGSTSTQAMTVSDGTQKTYSFDMTGVVGWTGNQTFVIGIGSLANGKATDAGTVEISSVVIDNTLSSNDFTSANFSVFPNPASSVLNIQGVNTISKVELFNITGKQVLKSSKLINNRLDISGLKSGLYLINIEDANNNRVVQKFIKE
ncbi:T9SS type A sorting domain-containing protein [Algibacter sp. 2305UL17-15]|uniref:T9SS type A sorting domain-containing protein n=1 Tax=Algibacter sp. 2305UL17-15 TaxID=3231268 RepID=UPI00345946F2